MKKNLFLAALCFLLPGILPAQSSFQTGTNVISAGAGFIGISWHGPTYSLNYERGLTDHFGAGLHAGYSEYTKSGYHYTAVIMGLKGAYHFATTETLDPYAGAELGYVSIKHTGSSESSAYHKYPSTGIGVFAGVRYYLSPGVGVYGELHLSTFSIIGLGLSFEWK